MDIGRLFIIGGIILVLAGVAFSLGLGKLPGDIVLRRGNVSFFFPIVSSIIISIVLTLILNLLLRR